jgi:predicted Zn-dependent protease
MVVARPGQIPASADPDGYARAVADLETRVAPDQLLAAYAAGHERWPQAPMLSFGLASQRAARADWAGAERLLRELLAADPAHVPARNNLAMVLMRMGRIEEAAQQAGEALAAAKGTQWEATVAETLAEIRAAR